MLIASAATFVPLVVHAACVLSSDALSVSIVVGLLGLSVVPVVALIALFRAGTLATAVGDVVVVMDREPERGKTSCFTIEQDVHAGVDVQLVRIALPCKRIVPRGRSTSISEEHGQRRDLKPKFIGPFDGDGARRTRRLRLEVGFGIPESAPLSQVSWNSRIDWVQRVRTESRGRTAYSEEIDIELTR